MEDISIKILAGFLVFLFCTLLGYYIVSGYRRSEGKRCEQCRHYHKTPYDEMCTCGQSIDEPIPALRTCFSFVDTTPPVKKYNNHDIS